MALSCSPASAGGAACGLPAGVARRGVEQQPWQCARGVPQQQSPGQPEQRKRFSVCFLVPHLRSPFQGEGYHALTLGSAGLRGPSRARPPGPQGRQGRCFRCCPPTMVCGPRRRYRDGAGKSRPHGRAPVSRAGGGGEWASGTYRIEAPPGRAGLRRLTSMLGFTFGASGRRAGGGAGGGASALAHQPGRVRGQSAGRRSHWCYDSRRVGLISIQGRCE